MSSSTRCIIIAEAGVNHNGDIALARKLVDEAAAAGADYVKFQTFKAEKLVSRSARKADYQIKNIGDGDDSQFAMLKKLELTEGMHHELVSYCAEKKIKFLSTPFDETSVDLLNALGMDTFKIPSGEITNLPYLRKIGSLKKKVILSTGMSTLQEIQDALKVFTTAGTSLENIIVLHCNTDYPTPFEDVNLRAMQTIRDACNVKAGYSDHTVGIEVPIAAVALGAVCIEKHFTLDRTLPGPDHKASLEPDELRQMISSIRNIEKSLGDGIKKPSPSESKNIGIVRKSIHLSRDLKKGEVIRENSLIMIRPGDGISPMRMEEVIGKKAKTDLKENHKLSFADLE